MFDHHDCCPGCQCVAKVGVGSGEPINEVMQRRKVQSFPKLRNFSTQIKFLPSACNHGRHRVRFQNGTKAEDVSNSSLGKQL